MAARAYCGFDGTEPATKVDGLLWGTPMAELAIWYNGAWHARGGGRPTLQAYGSTTLVPTPAWAATAFCGPHMGGGQGPVVPPAPPPPYTDGQLWFNTSVMRLQVRDTGFWIPLP